MNLKESLSYALDRTIKLGADKAEGIINESAKKELNIEAGKMSLFRTTFQSSFSIEAIKDTKQGTISINKIDKESIDKSIDTLINNVNSSEPDEANDISERQDPEVFNKGLLKPDLNLMYDKLDEFNNYVKDEHKKIILEAAILDHTSNISHIINTNGVDFQINRGIYNFSPMFTAKDGEKTSSFNYTYFSSLGLDEKIKDKSYLSELLYQSEEQLNTFPIKEKFVGSVIVTPHCLPDFLSFIESSISDGALISKTSIYKDKIGSKIASKKLSLSSVPLDKNIASGYFVTSDGYKAENVDIIKDGILQTHLLSLYGSNKTGGKRISNIGGANIISKGSESFENMIKNIDKGILLCRFSGGYPSDAGDFSGVAKNSYYIENGQIKHPLIETMVSGNIRDMILNIENISNENINFGNKILPWIAFNGLTIS